jgi:hypothetical protein
VLTVLICSLAVDERISFRSGEYLIEHRIAIYCTGDVIGRKTDQELHDELLARLAQCRRIWAEQIRLAGGRRKDRSW